MHFTSYKIRHLETVSSTNSRLKAEAEMGLATAGEVIIAQYQTEGKGRLNRTWQAPPGKAALFSVLLQPEIPTEKIPLLSLLVAIAALEGAIDALQDHLPYTIQNSLINFQLKWPNDILVNGKKICGILCESGITPKSARFAVAGIGFNILQTEEDFSPVLRPKSTSLMLELGQSPTVDKLIDAILARIYDYIIRLNNEGTKWIIPLWMSHTTIIGQRINIKTSMNADLNNDNRCLSGVCLGLTNIGSLRLKTDDGKILDVHSGDVV